MIDSLLADRDLIVDLVKNLTMLITVRLLSNNYRYNKIWELTTIYILIGFAIYHIFIKKLIIVNNINSKKIKRSIKTFSKLLTMFVIAHILYGGEFNLLWFKVIFIILLGYVIFDLFVYDILPINNIKSHQIIDSIRTTTQMITIAIIVLIFNKNLSLNKQFILSVLYTIIGFGVYDLGISNLL